MPNQPTPRLLCSVGIGRYESVVYRLGDKTSASRFAPVALAQLLGLSGGKANVLVTPSARDKWYEAIAAELRQIGLEPEPIEMPAARTEEEVLEVLRRLVELVGVGDRVILDVTFSLRHLPFVYLTALAYLTAYRDVAIAGIYYGALDLKGQDASGVEAPFLDMTPLFGLIQWYHSVQTARESGDLRAVARMLRGDVARLFQARHGDLTLSRAKDDANRLSAVLAAGLPIEAGFAARRMSKALAALERSSSPPGVAHLSLTILSGWLVEWTIPEAFESKEKLALSEEELRRELTLAQWYADRGDHPKALLLLREWLVSLFMLHRGNHKQWLTREHREHMAHYLSALARRATYGIATEAERRTAAIWGGVTNRRNNLAHAGMSRDDVAISPADSSDLIRQCRALLHETTAQSLPQPSGPRLLVTPLGLSPGVLYTAVQHVRPDQLIVITSTDAKRRLSEALDKSGSPHAPMLVRELADPHTGFQEAISLIDEEVRRWIVEAAEVMVNLTGGTTVIQYAAERVGDEARALGVPVRRVAVVDRRTPKQQQEQPYVLGELVSLDGVEEERDDPTA